MWNDFIHTQDKASDNGLYHKIVGIILLSIGGACGAAGGLSYMIALSVHNRASKIYPEGLEINLPSVAIEP
jgi:hypothetical protein